MSRGERTPRPRGNWGGGDGPPSSAGGPPSIVDVMGGLYAALKGLAWASYKRSVKELSDEELLELLGVLNVKGAMAEWVVRRLRSGEELGG